MEKLYRIDFMEYTNAFHDTVSNGVKEIGHGKYLHVGREPFIAKESDLDFLKQYGGGFRSCIFAGNLWEEKII